MNRLFLSLVLICFLQVVNAQDVWTLEKCIIHAIENNIQVKQQELLIEQSENNLKQSKAALLPNLNASTGYSLGWGRSLDPTTYNFQKQTDNVNASLNSSLTLFGGLQKVNTIKKNTIDLKAYIQESEKLKNDISLNVAAAYLQILLAEESLLVAKNQNESTKERIDKTKKIVDAGKLTLSNLLEVQAQSYSEETTIVNAQNNIDMAYLNLKQMLEIYDMPEFKVVSPEILSVAIPDLVAVQDLYNRALDIMPEIKNADLKLQSSKKSMDIAKGAYLPSLNLSGSYSSVYSAASLDSTFKVPFFEQMDHNRNTSLVFGLSIPIFNGLQVRTNVKNAKLAIRNQEFELQNVKNQLYKSIQQANADVQAQHKNYNATEKNVEALKESFRYTESKLDAGVLTSTDYIVAKNNLFKAQSDYLQAKYSYIFKLKILDFYKGLPLKL